jgi:hypothetical protein
MVGSPPVVASMSSLSFDDLDDEEVFAHQLMAAGEELITVDTFVILAALDNLCRREAHGAGWRLVHRRGC